MREREPELRRARSLLAYWREGKLHFRNYAERSTISAKPVTCELLDWFDSWRTVAQAIRHFSRYNAESVSSTVASLVRYRILLARNSAEAKFDAELEKRWAGWLPDASFHFSTKDARYIKRQRSLSEWAAILPKRPAPRVFKSLSSAAKITLPKANRPSSEFTDVLLARQTHRQFSTASISLEQVSHLLSLVWGVTGYLESPVFGRLLRKTSPSGGARHPGEVYLVALRVEGLKRGIYHYHPGRHCLETISSNATPAQAKLYCASQKYARSAAALFIMTAVFDRTMWKYPKARAYRVVLLDAGHLAQTFCLVASWLGLAPFCTAALSDTMIERDLGIDGINESVLYLTGVGLPKASRRAVSSNAADVN